MTITANYFMTIFGVVLAIGFSYRLLVAKPGPKRPLSVLAANQHAAGHSGEACCTASSAALVVGVAAFAALTARTDCFATFETLIALAAGSYSFAVAFRRHLERTIE